jgi:hypothetical protein
LPIPWCVKDRCDEKHRSSCAGHSTQITLLAYVAIAFDTCNWQVLIGWQLRRPVYTERDHCNFSHEFTIDREWWISFFTSSDKQHHDQRSLIKGTKATPRPEVLKTEFGCARGCYKWNGQSVVECQKRQQPLTFILPQVFHDDNASPDGEIKDFPEESMNKFPLIFTLPPFRWPNETFGCFEKSNLRLLWSLFEYSISEKDTCTR